MAVSRVAAVGICALALGLTGFALGRAGLGSASAISPGTSLRIWQSRTPGEYVAAIVFNPAGTRLAVVLRRKGSPESRVAVLDVRGGRVLLDIDVPGKWPTVCFAPDGANLAVLQIDGGASAGTVTLHDIESGRRRVVIDPVDPRSGTLAFSADGQTLVTAPFALTVRISFRDGPPQLGIELLRAWRIATGEQVPHQRGRGDRWAGPTQWGALSLDGSIVAEGGWPGPTPRVYDRWGGERITYCFRSEWPVCYTFTPDNRLASIHEDGLFVLWEIRPTGNANAKQLLTRSGFNGTTALAFSDDGQILATGHADGSVKLRRGRDVGVQPIRRSR